MGSWWIPSSAKGRGYQTPAGQIYQFSGIAGATILGDGTVSLIIDVSQLLDLA
jgi:hypothetical protein